MHIHPRWPGDAQKGYDAAMLRLLTPINVITPTLAAATFDLYPNSRVNGFRIGTTPGATEFTVVAEKFCPQIKGADNMLCAFSRYEKAYQGG